MPACCGKQCCRCKEFVHQFVSQGWNYYDRDMHIGHSSLSMWGRNALVLTVDIDEWLVPGQPRAIMSQLLAPGGCLAALNSPNCITFPRRDIFPYEEQPAVGAQPDEPGWWRNASGGLPLRNYRFVSDYDPNSKTISRPESVATPSIHNTCLCIGQDTVANGSAGATLESACSKQEDCPIAPMDCAMLLHTQNTFQVRPMRGNISRIRPSEWLWVLDEHERQ